MTDLFNEKAKDWDVNEMVKALSAAVGSSILDHVSLHAAFLSMSTRKDELSSALVLPLKVGSEVLGVLNIAKLKGNIPHFTESDLEVMSVMAGQAASALQNIILMEKMDSLFLSTVKSLSKAIDTKSPWTAGHSERVTACSLLIGQEMGLKECEMKWLELAATLHDIGKIGTHDGILDKPGKLTEKEYNIVRRHPADGANILSGIKELKDVVPAIKYHHERFDGKGYPSGKKNEDIPLFARIIAVADSYDAMVSDRPYRQGKTVEEITDDFKQNAGKQFDPHITSIFLENVISVGSFNHQNKIILKTSLPGQLEKVRGITLPFSP